MKSKDEIIQQEIDKLGDYVCFHPDHSLYDGSTEPIYNAMDTYASIVAKQEAISFSEWNCKNLWSTYNGMWYPYQDEDNHISGDELYNLYMQSKQNQWKVKKKY